MGPGSALRFAALVRDDEVLLPYANALPRKGGGSLRGVLTSLDPKPHADVYLIISMSAPSPLRHRAIIQPAVEPVLVARDVLLHRDVDERLVERDARDVGKREIDEALDVGIVGRGVAIGGRDARAVQMSDALEKVGIRGALAGARYATVFLLDLLPLASDYARTEDPAAIRAAVTGSSRCRRA